MVSGPVKGGHKMPNVRVNADGTVTVGTADGDVLIALDGEDNVLIGGAGEDALIGGDGNDKLVGGSGDDDLSGNGGLDLLIGGADDDVLDGGTDDDVLIGGSGFDTYVFGENSGVDAIMGFNTAEDTIDLSGANISSLDGRVTEDANGNAVIDLGDGNSVTVAGVSAADLLANGNFVLAPSGPVTVELGIDDTFTDLGDGVDHIITGDVNGEQDTDTDTFIFVPGSGDDTITDFRYEDFDINEFGIPITIEGDILDLSAYGIYGDDLTDAGFPAYLDSLVAQGLLQSYSVTMPEDAVQQTVLTFADGSSLTLLGIGEIEIGIIIEENLVRETGGGIA